MPKPFLIFAGMAVFLGAGMATLGATKAVPIPAPRPHTRPQAPAEQAAPAAQPSQAKPSQAKSGAGAPIVMSVKVGERAGVARFAIEISDPVAIRTFTLKNPDRVVFDLPSVQWKLSVSQKPKAGGLIRSYRYGRYRPGNSRFVVDLNRPAAVASPKVLLPQGGYGYRLLVDLEPASRAQFDKTAGWPADLKAREQAAEARAVAEPTPRPGKAEINGVETQKGGRKVVVLDPGHGGIDDGTIGIDGTKEKDVVLDEVRFVRSALQTRGYQVFVTHDTDEFIPLQQRVALARARRADLFISIHADSIHDPRVSGLSVYTLSDKGSDDEARALAAKENQSDTLAGVDLAGRPAAVASILIDLAQRDSLNKSSRFAEAALRELQSVTPILPRQPHRSAALVVLKAPDVPAVLIELGYLSNADDAARMRKNAWRQAVASAIAQAVDRYFTDPSGTGATRTRRKRTTPP